MKFKLIFIITAILMLSAPVVPAYAQQALPDLTGRVIDNADILSDDTEKSLTSLSEQLERATTDQLVIVIVPTLNGQSVESYARDLGNAWGIGQKEKDNGIIFLIAPQDKVMRIAVGSGLQNTLTDGIAQQIINETIIPRFKENQMEAGIINGTKRIKDFLAGDITIQEPSFLEKVGEWILIAILLPFVLIARLFGFKGKGFKGGGGRFGSSGASGKW
mgnify:CR=1 FL=1